MKYVFLIIGSLLLLSAGRGVQEVEDKVVLSEKQQELAVVVLSLYLEVDSNQMAEEVASFDPTSIYRTVARVDSVVKVGIELAMQNRPWALMELLEKEREYFYAHPNNVIDNEVGFHQLLIILYQMCYGNTKTAFAKIVPLMEFTRFHIHAWEVIRDEEHPYYIDALVDLLRCCIWAEEYEKAIEVGEEWCERMEKGDEDYIAGMVILGKLYGRMGKEKEQKRCFRQVKDSPLSEKLNAKSLSELCE